MLKIYPTGTRLAPWTLAKDAGAVAIRRWVYFENGTRTFERYPKTKYAHLLKDTNELEKFIIRLNGFDPAAVRSKNRVTINHAFVSEEFLTEYFEKYLSVQIPTQKDAATMFSYLKRQALDFFINKLSLPNPLEWHRNQHVWGKYLLNKEDKSLEAQLRIFEPGEIRSAKVLRYTVYELNRFMKYLHMKRPDEIPALTFEPISKAAYKEHDARRKMVDQVRQSKYVPPADWLKIKNALETQDAPWRYAIYLAYYYGLRRNEAQGLQLSDLRQAFLSCERQFEGHSRGKIPKYGPLKNRTSRKVPHWFIEPATAYAYIEALQGNLFHPDTLGAYFTALVEDLCLPEYTLHDLRRTFITNAVKKGIAAEDLRLAVGHSDIQTTYKFYVMDSRELEEQVWTPTLPKAGLLAK